MKLDEIANKVAFDLMPIGTVVESVYAGLGRQFFTIKAFTLGGKILLSNLGENLFDPKDFKIISQPTNMFRKRLWTNRYET